MASHLEQIRFKAVVEMVGDVQVVDAFLMGDLNEKRVPRVPGPRLKVAFAGIFWIEHVAWNGALLAIRADDSLVAVGAGALGVVDVGDDKGMALPVKLVEQSHRVGPARTGDQSFHSFHSPFCFFLHKHTIPHPDENDL